MKSITQLSAGSSEWPSSVFSNVAPFCWNQNVILGAGIGAAVVVVAAVVVARVVVVAAVVPAAVVALSFPPEQPAIIPPSSAAMRRTPRIARSFALVILFLPFLI